MTVKSTLYGVAFALLLVGLCAGCGREVDPQPIPPKKTKNLNIDSNGKNNTDGANGVGSDSPEVQRA